MHNNESTFSKSGCCSVVVIMKRCGFPQRRFDLGSIPSSANNWRLSLICFLFSFCAIHFFIALFHLKPCSLSTAATINSPFSAFNSDTVLPLSVSLFHCYIQATSLWAKGPRYVVFRMNRHHHINVQINMQSHRGGSSLYSN